MNLGQIPQAILPIEGLLPPLGGSTRPAFDCIRSPTQASMQNVSAASAPGKICRTPAPALLCPSSLVTTVV